MRSEPQASEGGPLKGVVRASAVLALLCALACSTAPRIEVDETPTPAPWTNLAVADDARDFSFAVVSDRTGGHRDGVFEAAIDALNLLRPAFAVSIGDLIEGNAEDPAQLDAMWAEFEAIVARLQMPFFHVPGNHDYANPAMARDWTRRFGPSFYHFRYKDVLFLVLNSELFSSYANPGHAVEGGESQQAQMRYIERVLAEPAARWTFVLLHQPFWDTPGEHPDWERVETLLGDRPYTVLAGHFHRYTEQIRHGREYITLGTTGGRSALRGVQRGEFDHVMLVTLGSAGPVIANLMLDGIYGADVHDAAMRKLMGELDRVVTTEPLIAVGERFCTGEQRFALHNGSDRPVTVRGRFPAGATLSASPEQLERTLAPGASEQVSVQLRARPAVAVARATPSLAHWAVEAQGERESARSESASWMIPDQLFAVRAGAPVAVDADLREWAPLRFALEYWPVEGGGSAEASLHFDVRHDADFLYLAFDVSDRTPGFSTARVAQQQDGVTVELDARPDPARSSNGGVLSAIEDGTMASLLITTLGAVEPLADPTLTRILSPPPEGLRRAVRLRDGGYSAELAVPRSFLDERAGGDWQRFRLNVVLQDFDETGSGQSYEWRPSRFAAPSVTIPGAGTFVRQ